MVRVPLPFSNWSKNSAIRAAEVFLDLAWRDSEALTPLKLQKLVYIAHGWHLALQGEPLFDDQVEAWAWGPVIPPVYHHYKGFGRMAIAHNGKETNSEEFVESVWKPYCHFTGVQLMNMTHGEGTPWHETVKPYLDVPEDIPRGLKIANDAIKKHYEKIAEQRGN